MNYPTFLNKTDALCKQADTASLRAFIHEIARSLPERNRERFLDTLVSFVGEEETKEARVRVPEDAPIGEQVQGILDALEEIQNGRHRLNSEYNEEWDDWNESEEVEFLFSDPDKLLEDILRAFDMLHTCVDREAYAEGARLAASLAALTVSVDGDYSEFGDDLDVDGLIDNDLLKVDMKKAASEAVYLAFMGAPADERAEAILTVLYGFSVRDFSLENLLQAGQKEIDLDAFLPSWIEALGKRTERLADRLLMEAQSMLNDAETVLENAHRYAETHPDLYRQILASNQGKGKDENMLAAGLRALDEVSMKQPVRNDIALLTAEYAFALHQKDTAEACWMEAFRTVPSVVNYLRLRLLTGKWAEWTLKVRTCYQNYYGTENAWNKKPQAAILFFEGDLDGMKNQFMQADNGIGWSSTFMKEGIALILLLLEQGNLDSPGLMDMWDKALHACEFTATSYYAGTGHKAGQKDMQTFRDVFGTWKKQENLTQAEQVEWLDQLEKWVNLRVTAIMDANRRNYYGECAAFVAALGEVKESLGATGAKAALMEKYRMRYTRRRLFHDELRKYGMNN